MKLPRLWPDALRQTRLMTWAPLLIPVLVFLTLADRWYPSYAEHRERHAEIALRLERAQAVADLLPRYQEKADAQIDGVEAAKKTALTNEQVDASLDITPDTPEGTSAGSALLLRVDLRLLVSPQQLAGLEARLLPFKDRFVPVEMELTVVPDPKRASRQLDARFHFRVMHMDKAPVTADASASVPPAAATVPPSNASSLPPQPTR
jgi:hypothetical protein